MYHQLAIFSLALHIPNKITTKSNGLEFYCFEVTKEPSHSQYALSAYGEEALELFKEVERRYSVTNDKESSYLKSIQKREQKILVGF
jgi:hypothetical protein